MPMYVVVRKQINSGYFLTPNKAPSTKEVLHDIESYPKVFVFDSLKDAQSVSKMFFHAPQLPKVGGAYGLIATVAVAFTEMPSKTNVTEYKIHQNWLDTQKLNYFNKGTETSISCYEVKPQQIQQILKIHIPEDAVEKNHLLTEQQKPKCTIL